MCVRAQAQLRAAVFCAVDEQERGGAGGGGAAQFQGNPHAGAIWGDPRGRLAASLVADYLASYALRATASVFFPEAGGEPQAALPRGEAAAAARVPAEAAQVRARCC